MPIRSAQLPERLRGGLSHVYLFAGPEPLLVQECRDRVREAAAKQGYLEREILHVDRHFDWASLATAAGTPSLFAERKIIDLRMPTGKPGREGAGALVEWAQSPDPDTLLIVSCEQWDTSSRKSKWAEALDRAGTRIDIWPVKAAELPRWIEGRMRQAGLEPEPEAVLVLADRLEGNLLAAQQEIEKLLLLKGCGTVTTVDVLQSVANSSRFDAFTLMERTLAGDLADGLRVATGLRRTDVPLPMITGAVNHELRVLDALRMALKAGEPEGAAFAGCTSGKAARRYCAARLPVSTGNVSRRLSAGWRCSIARARAVPTGIPGTPWTSWWSACAPEPGAGLPGMTHTVGIFGGTFDPVHYGHLKVADEVRQGLSIEDFRLLPAGEPPHRRVTHASAQHRLAMLELAIVEYPGLELDTRELDRPGPSYMVDTLLSLRAELSDTPLLLVIGQDSANQLDSWHRWREIPRLAHLVVISRPGRESRYEGELAQFMEARLTGDAGRLMCQPAGLVLPFRVSAVNLSSTAVRHLIAAGAETRHCLPDTVAAYIAGHGLYAPAGSATL